MSLPKTQATATAASNYQAVRESIERARLSPWASAVGIKIDSFVVAPLSFRSFVDLELAGNAFITGAEPLVGDIAAYIWRHMPEYSPTADSKAFVKKIAEHKDAYTLISGIWSHFACAFDETPAASEFGGFVNDNRLPPTPSIASICSEYGAAYGIDPQDVADIDLRIVFQCCRVLRMKDGAKYSEPRKLRDAKSDFLKAHGKN